MSSACEGANSCRQYRSPLNPDAFTNFIPRADLRAANHQIYDATEELRNRKIPEFAGILDVELAKRSKDFNLAITVLMHGHGINMR